MPGRRPAPTPAAQPHQNNGAAPQFMEHIIQGNHNQQQSPHGKFPAQRHVQHQAGQPGRQRQKPQYGNAHRAARQGAVRITGGIPPGVHTVILPHAIQIKAQPHQHYAPIQSGRRQLRPTDGAHTAAALVNSVGILAGREERSTPLNKRQSCIAAYCTGKNGDDQAHPQSAKMRKPTSRPCRAASIHTQK